MDNGTTKGAEDDPVHFGSRLQHSNSPGSKTSSPCRIFNIGVAVLQKFHTSNVMGSYQSNTEALRV